MRPIDADAVLDRLPDDLPYKGSVKRVLMQAPTIDAVEVVLCRDCMFWKSTVEDGVFSITYGECRCPLGEWREMETTSTDYCSNGRREADGDG